MSIVYFHALVLTLCPGLCGYSEATLPRKPDSSEPKVSDIVSGYRKYKQMTSVPHSVSANFLLGCKATTRNEVEKEREKHGPHANASILIYMNDHAAESFQKKKATYPVGSVIVKHKSFGVYQDKGEIIKSNDGVGGMIKRAPGYDPEHGDWEYFYFEDPKKVESGKIANCVQCHATAKTTDYVFGAWRKSAEEQKRTTSDAKARPTPTKTETGKKHE